MSKAAERDLWASARLDQLLGEAAETALDALPIAISGDLQTLFRVSATGFREIVLTVVMATLLDPNYRASLDLYACNPRPLYESGLRPTLEKFNIPCAQSGPLNVAKAAQALNPAWAAKRRPAEAAASTLRVVAFLEADPLRAEELAQALAFLFHAEAIGVVALNSSVGSPANLDQLVKLCVGLIAAAPDRGNTPQRICGYLLEESLANARVAVFGASDSASTTNATSNKPGDVCVVTDEGEVSAVYEITVKKFSAQRISECSQSLRSFRLKTGQSIPVVRVLCRPEDVPLHVAAVSHPKFGLQGLATEGDITYEFFDIDTWVASMLVNLSTKHRLHFFQQLKGYVNHPNTKKNVKLSFADLAEASSQRSPAEPS